MAQKEKNVLFVRFEDMKTDLVPVIRQISDFLGIDPLDDEEMGQVTRKCGFEYMRDHKDAFEMHPPHILAVDEQMFVRGTADRHKDVDEETGARVLDWCRGEMAAGEPTLEQLYPV